MEQGKDSEPSAAKTVRRVVTSMKEMFFDIENDQVRSACYNSFVQMLEQCFLNKRYGKEN